MGSTKALPIFLFLVEQITQTSDRPAMIARDRLGMEQTAQHTFLHALGHRPEQRIDGVVVEHTHRQDGFFGVVRHPVGRGGRNRTFGSRNQNPVPYRLATPLNFLLRRLRSTASADVPEDC